MPFFFFKSTLNEAEAKLQEAFKHTEDQTNFDVNDINFCLEVITLNFFC